MSNPKPTPLSLVLPAATLLAAGAAALAAPALKPAARVISPAHKPASALVPVDFARDVRPILSAKCYACHGPDAESRQAGVRLDLRDEAIKGAAGRQAIRPGSAAASRAYIRIAAKVPAQRMPPPGSGHSLQPAEIDIIRRWIDQGAPYADHWAFQKVRRPQLPAVKNAAWVRNPIDNFVLARLEREGLRPAPEADRHTLIRRLSLDLTGLPPTPQEVDAFVADRSPDAYEKVVDRLLASPHYGERWARMWLDLARYADSAGYGSDPLRMNIWPYRDWVVNAFNRNLPYDQFTIEQLAGDLLPNATPDQIAATAFHRNTMTNTEGGTDDEEFRVAAVKDRIATTSQVWMGLTMGCAQCHTHKFDPITHREYYQFYAFFNQTEDNDRPDEAPTMPTPSAEQRAATERLQGEIADLEKRFSETSPQLLTELAEWERKQAAPVRWTPLEVTEARAASGTQLSIQPDGSLLASGASPDSDTYTVKLKTPLKGVTAFRLEALSHASLPATGPGRASSGNLVLSTFRLTAAPGRARPVLARYLRIENPGTQRILSLAEVQVLSGGTNVAVKGKATQSSTDYDGPPEKAIDGNTDGIFDRGSTTHTRIEDNPWWEVDLGREVPVESVSVWNRTDATVGSRLANFRVIGYSAERKPVWETKVAAPPNPSVRLSTSGEADVSLRNASATHEQPDFSVDRTLDTDAKTGWALGGALGRDHAAVFETGTPLGDESGLQLTATLVQSYGGQHTLGRFRLLATDTPLPVRELPHGIRALLATAPDRRTEAQRAELLAYFRPLAPSMLALNRELVDKRKQLTAIKPVQLPVLRELDAAKQRTTRIMVKGNFLVPGETVQAALPAAFAGSGAAPKNRLDVARWLVSADHPLTARVAVNRFWAQLFGTGIVETEEDFGTQGALPTHPELLDFLASLFSSAAAQSKPATITRGWRGERGAGSGGALVAASGSKRSTTPTPPHPHTSIQGLGWDMKALVRLIVTSSTYRQASRGNVEAAAKDPRNRLLARFPRRRLEAETVRDQALALSGLLTRKIGGPSVYPPQPDGLWRAAFNGQRTWPTSTGEDRYRRGLYTFWRRTVPYPSMATFDAPSREICTVRRLPTNTPLQALVTLNDPAFVEMSQALGRRLVREGGATPRERAAYGLRLVLARPVQEEQVRALTTLFEKELQDYRQRPDAAKKLATDPLGPLPEGIDAAEAAAWTVVGNVLLNLDSVLTRN